MLLFAFGIFGTVESPVVAQLDAVVVALSQGDAVGVGRHFDQTVELVLPGVEDIFTKDKAQVELERFFSSNQAQNFARVHGGTSSGEKGTYVIGTLTTDTGSYRVYVYGRGDAAPTVQELRIEAE